MPHTFPPMERAEITEMLPLDPSGRRRRYTSV